MISILLVGAVILGLSMMAVLTESAHDGEFLISEAPQELSREQVTIVSGAGKLAAGSVLGKIKYGAISQAFAGTGNGTMGSLVRAASGCVAGAWKVRCINAQTNGGIFEVVDPNGMSRGTVAVGVAFSNGIGFTIADGATDFVLGDTFTVTVAAGSGKYNLIDPEDVTGLQEAAGILYGAVDATSADKQAAMIARDAEVLTSSLNYSDADATETAAIKAALKALGIIVREVI